jgi:hypothetical protein
MIHAEDRIRVTACGCRYDVVTALRTHLCETHTESREGGAQLRGVAMPKAHYIGWQLTPIRSSDRCRLAGRPEADRLYASRRSAERAARRLGPGIVVTRVCTCPVPSPNDAAGWDAYRIAHGYAGGWR